MTTVAKTNMQALFKDKAWSVALLMRDVLQQQTSYADALKRLQSVKIIAPVYIILGGIKKGSSFFFGIFGNNLTFE